MKKITLMLAFLLPTIGFSQTVEQKIQSYLDVNQTKLGLTNQDINDWFVESEGSSDVTKINNYYVKQRVNGTEVFGAVSNFWVKNGAVINGGDRFVSNSTQKINATVPQISVAGAVSKAFMHLGIPPFVVNVIEAKGDKNFILSNGALADDPIVAELVYHQTEVNTLMLAWDLTFYTQDHKNLWSLRIDALNGDLLDKHDMVINCVFDDGSGHVNHNHMAAFTKDFFRSAESIMEVQSGSYRVVPFNIESPAHGPRQLLSSPANLTASPYGWHDTNGIAGAEHTITRGNNVFAMEDRDANNGAGMSAEGGPGLVFDFPYGGNSVQSDTYTNASVTNLFYMNNMLHDVWFNYGFNEQNGNFQQKNYSGYVQGGLFGDAVQADAQDGAEADPPNLNNANFSTPSDGTRPRMQMYLWSNAPRFFFVTGPSSVAGGYQAAQNSFNPGNVPIPPAPGLERQLVLYLDGGATTSEACVPPSNAAAMAGKIVILRRGNCDFVVKVKNAQNAGAVGVVVVDNLPNQLINMGGGDATITIPAIAITQALGNALISLMATQTVTVKFEAAGADPYINGDGDFDNNIIAHEYGHGISNRLIGGGNNTSCLQNGEQAGEGWSDWIALMMQLKPGDQGSTPKGIASFSSNQPINGGGIRSFPYSTDMSVNPLTFADSNTTAVHDRGEVMAAVLWDLTWAYVDKYGLDGNVLTGTGGNNKAMQIVMDAFKLVPCSPTFIEYRDAIIAADQATTNGQDFCLIWKVFARRGMGVTASSGSRTNGEDQTENFSEPTPGANCTLSVDYFNIEDMIRIYPNPANGLVNIRINQFSGKLNVQVVDLNGRVVYSAPNTDFNIQTTLDLRHLQSGMYVVKINGDSLNYNHKIILN